MSSRSEESPRLGPEKGLLQLWPADRPPWSPVGVAARVNAGLARALLCGPKYSGLLGHCNEQVPSLVLPATWEVFDKGIDLQPCEVTCHHVDTVTGLCVISLEGFLLLNC